MRNSYRDFISPGSPAKISISEVTCHIGGKTPGAGRGRVSVQMAPTSSSSSLLKPRKLTGSLCGIALFNAVLPFKNVLTLS